jgi:hypothetical protein
MRTIAVTLLLILSSLSASADIEPPGRSAELVSAMQQLSKRNEAEYRRQITALCERGDANAQVLYGRFLITKQEFVEAERWLKRAAAQGSAESQFALGLLFTQLNPPQFPEVKLWMGKAASQGDARAKAVLRQFERKPRGNNPNLVSVLDIAEGAEVFARLNIEGASDRKVECSGHTRAAFNVAAAEAIDACSSQLQQQHGEWVDVGAAKSVGLAWGQCVNREILRPTKVRYEDFMRCNWQPKP